MRNSAYFRKLQGIKSVSEYVDENIEYILDCIENFIKSSNGSSFTSLRVYIPYNSAVLNQTIEKLRNEYDFSVYDTCVEGDGKASFRVCWDGK